MPFVHWLTKKPQARRVGVGVGAFNILSTCFLKRRASQGGAFACKSAALAATAQRADCRIEANWSFDQQKLVDTPTDLAWLVDEFINSS